MDQHHLFLAMHPALRVEFLHGLTHLEWCGGWRHRFAEADGHGVGEIPWYLPEETAFLEAKNAAPHMVEADGNDRRIHIFHHPLETTSEREQLANARDLSLGEDADDVAVLDRLARGAQ